MKRKVFPFSFRNLCPSASVKEILFGLVLPCQAFVMSLLAIITRWSNYLITKLPF